MVLVITLCIIIIVVGILLIIFSKKLFPSEKWKYTSNTQIEPSDQYVYLRRIYGGIIIVIGLLFMIAYVMFSYEEKYWNATYETEFSNSKYWTFNEDGTLEQSNRGTYSFIEKEGEFLIQLTPEGEEPNTFSNAYVAQFNGDQMQLIPYLYYFEYDSIKDYAEETGESPLTLEDVTLTFNLIEGTNLNEVSESVNAIYQMIKDGKDIAYKWCFYSDGTYEDILTQNYKVNNEKGIIKIGNTTHSYIENVVTGELYLYLEEDAFSTLKRISINNMP